MPSPRLTLTLAAAVSALAVPAAASADTFCVSAPGCSGTPIAGLNIAIATANAHDGPDRVEVGPGTFNGAFNVNSGTTLAGAGRNLTKLTGGGGEFGPALSVNGPGAVARDLAVTGPGSKLTDDAALEVNSGGRAQDVYAARTGQDSLPAIGVDDGELVDVEAETAEPATGVLVRGDLTARRLKSSGDAALTIVGKDAQVRVEDSELVGQNNSVVAEAGNLTIEDTLLRFKSAGNGIVGIMNDGPGAPRSIDVRGATVISSGADHSGFTLIGAVPGRPFRLTVADTVIAPEIGRPVRRLAFGGPADVVLDHVNRGDIRADDDISQGAGSGAIAETSRVLGTPGFAAPNAGDYRLSATSALIDAGSAAPSGVDRDGKARVADGNGDCLATRDLGAFERPAVPATRVCAVPAPPTASAPAPAVPRAAVAQARDHVKPKVTKLTVKRGGKRLTGSFRVSERSRVTVRLERIVKTLAGKHRVSRVVGRATVVQAKSGTNRFRVVLPKRLRKGQYRIAVQAVDAAGNRGTAVRRAVTLRR